MKSSNKLLAIGALGAGVILTVNYIHKKKQAYQLGGKVVLITGGSRGLGLNLAKNLLMFGARVVICSRDKDELQAALIELTDLGPDILAIQCDVTDQAQVQKMIAEIESRLGKVEILINNAGIIQVGPFENMTVVDFENAMKIHFWAPLYTTMAVLEGMKSKREGRIVNISSIGGKVTIPHLLPYTASKFALSGFSQGLRAELKKYKIKVTTIYPGLMRTGSMHNITVKGQHEKEYAAFSITGSMPLITVSAEYAAKRIIYAIIQGTVSEIVSLPAKLLAGVYKVFPGLATDVFGFIDQILPKATSSDEAKMGYESYSKWSPSFLTVMSDDAARRNNEL